MVSGKYSFREGYNGYIKNVGSYVGGELSRLSNQPYLDSIQIEIDNLTKAINSYEANGNPQLKGYVAEAWHTYTFNIDAAAKHSMERTTQVQSNGLGSVDISTSWGSDYSLKYYSTGKGSAFAQGHPLEFAYQKYIHNLKEGSYIPTREEYLKNNGIDPKTDMALGMYEGQARLIPSDQIQDAIDALNKRIQKELNNLDNPDRAKVAERLIQVRDKLTSHISGPNGEESLGLTESDSRVLANQAKEGKFDPERYNITLAKKADCLFLARNAMMAGLNAAWISALIKMMPQLVVVLKRLLKDGYIDPDGLKETGKEGVSGAKTGFISGFFCAAITTSAQLGYLGDTLKSAVNSTCFVPFVSVAVVMLRQSVSDGIKCAKGEMSNTQYAYNIEKSMYVGVGGLSGGLALQAIIEIPVVSYAVGSMIGSLLGGLIFTVKEQVMLSLCVKHGYTVFGLVSQDYTLPDSVREKLGFPIYGHEEYEWKKYQWETYNWERYDWKKYNWKDVDCIVLKRGVVGFRKVGYI